MKKTYISLACFALLLAGASTAFAGTKSSQAAATPYTVTITSTVTGSPDFTFTPSPNVLINTNSTQTEYAMESWNSVTKVPDGMVYGALSTSTGYAQRPMTGSDTTAAPPTPASETGLEAPTTWTWLGGS